MKFLLDENNYIIGYVCIGDIEGAVEVDCEEADIPCSHFEAYQYIDGQFILDDNKLQEIIAEENRPHLSEVEELRQRVATLEEYIQTHTIT